MVHSIENAHFTFGVTNSPKDRAKELVNYCKRHIKEEKAGAELYRVFYYDCPPSEKRIYHPLLQKQIFLSQSDQYKWANAFFHELMHQRKFALRMGRLAEEQAFYNIKPATTRKLLNGAITINDLTEGDFTIDIKQKGVDMRIGVDILSK